MRAHLSDIAAERRAAHAALPAFTSYDLTTADAAVRAAESADTPVALLVSPKTAAGRSGLGLIRALRTLADAATVPVCVQLDHATDPALIAAAVQAGADAVLADGSREGTDANARFVARIRAELPARIAVEAELGRIEGDEDVASAAARPGRLTDPDTVPDFLDRSGADLLAVSIGNVHGRYTAEPRLDWTRLAAIRARAGDTPLVLHGASGLPADDLHRALDGGVCKVNVNTELRRAVFDTLGDELDRHREHGLDLDSLLAAWGEAVAARAGASIRSLTRVDVVR